MLVRVPSAPKPGIDRLFGHSSFPTRMHKLPPPRPRYRQTTNASQFGAVWTRLHNRTPQELNTHPNLSTKAEGSNSSDQGESVWGLGSRAARTSSLQMALRG